MPYILNPYGTAVTPDSYALLMTLLLRVISPSQNAVVNQNEVTCALMFFNLIFNVHKCTQTYTIMYIVICRRFVIPRRPIGGLLKGRLHALTDGKDPHGVD